MAVREFTDSRGREWRVWDVTPEHMHSVTRGEDYMANLQDGWLAFESGTQKRRIEAPYPSDWTTYGIKALEQLCERATPVVRRTTQTSTGKHRAVRASKIEAYAIEATSGHVTFRSPGGREWTVRVHECLDRAGEEQMVLRFTADDIVVELARWPSDWESCSTEQFALLLLDANPPRRRKQGEGPQRRHEDRVPLHEADETAHRMSGPEGA